MKTRSFLESSSNIAAIVKARRNAPEMECTSFSQLANDVLLINNTTNTNPISNENQNLLNNSQNIIPEKKGKIC